MVDDDGGIFGMMADTLAGESDDMGAAYFTSTSLTSASSASSLTSEQAALLRRNADSFHGRPNHGFCGLDNQGATCYLNSLLQTLYMAPEFRRGMYALDEKEIGLAEYEVYERAEEERKAAIAALESSSKEAKEKIQAAAAEQKKLDDIQDSFDYLVGSMGCDQKQAVKALLHTRGNREAATNYVFEHDFTKDNEANEPDWTLYSRLWQKDTPATGTPGADDKPKDGVIDLKKAGKPAGQFLLIELRRLFSRLQLAQQKSTDTYGLTKAFGWHDGQSRDQHDIQQLWTVLLNGLEKQVQRCGDDRKEILKLVNGTEVQILKCQKCGVTRRKTNPLNYIPAHVKGIRDLNHAMVHMITPEDVDLRCGEPDCGGKKFTKRVCVESLPALVTFFLERYEWNMRTGNRDKVSDKFAFPLVIDMAPYLEANIDRPQVPLPTPVVVAPVVVKEQPAATPAAAATSTNDDVKTATTSKTGASGNNEKKKGGKKTKQEEEDEIWPPLEQPAYDETSPHLCDLFAVVIHSGSAHGGHYHAYIRDPVSFVAHKEGSSSAAQDNKDSKPIWYDFNDSRVTPIPTEQLAMMYGNAAKKGENAYMLMYRRRAATTAVTGTPCLALDLCRTAPVVPATLAKTVGDANAKLAVERAQYDFLTSQVAVNIHAASRYQVVDGKLVCLIDPNDKEAQAAGRDDVEVDQRCHPRVLLSAIAANDKLKLALGLPAGLTAPPLADEAENTSDTPAAAPLVTWKPKYGVADFAADSPVWALRFNLLSFDGRPPFNITVGPRVDLSFSGDSKTRSLESFGVRGNTTLLAWNGVDINGAPFTPPVAPAAGVKQVGLRVTYYHMDHSIPATADLDVRVRRDEFPLLCEAPQPLTLLADLLAKRTSLPLASLLIHRVIGSNDESKLQPLVITRDAGITIGESGLVDGSQIIVEPVAEGVAAGSLSMASQVFAIIQSRISLDLLDHITPKKAGTASNTDSAVRLVLDRHTTLRTLQERMIALFNIAPITGAPLRLRRVIGQTNPGGLYRNLDLTIEKAGLCNDMRVRIEEGPLPKDNELDLFAIVEHIDRTKNTMSPDGSVVTGGYTRVRQSVPVILDANLTIKQSKAKLLELLDMKDRSESEYCLHKMNNGFGDKGKVFGNEFITLEKVKMGDGDTLWLEEGVLPIKGQILLSVFMFNPSQYAYELAARVGGGSAKDKENNDIEKALAASLDNSTPAPVAANVAAAADVDGKRGTSSSSESPVVAAAEVKETKSGEEKSAGATTTLTAASAGGVRNRLLLPLFSLPFSNTWALGDLKIALHTFPNSPLASAPTAGHIRIRNVSKADEVGKMICGDDLPLSKCKINTDAKIAIQLLTVPEVGLSQSTMVLYSTLAAAPPDGVSPSLPSTIGQANAWTVDPVAVAASATAATKAVVVNELPMLVAPRLSSPIELIFDGGAAPQLSTLQAALARQYPGIPAQHIGIAKWYGNQRLWRIIHHEGPPPDSLLVAFEREQDAILEVERQAKAKEAAVKQKEKREVMAVVKAVDQAEAAAKKGNKLENKDNANPKKGGKGGNNNNNNNGGNGGKQQNNNNQPKKGEKGKQESKTGGTTATAATPEADDAKRAGGAAPSKKAENKVDDQHSLLRKPYLLHDTDLVAVIDLRQWCVRGIDVVRDWPYAPGVSDSVRERGGAAVGATGNGASTRNAARQERDLIIEF